MHYIMPPSTMKDIFNINKASFMTQTFSVGQVYVADDCKELISAKIYHQEKFRACLSNSVSVTLNMIVLS